MKYNKNFLWFERLRNKIKMINNLIWDHVMPISFSRYLKNRIGYISNLEYFDIMVLYFNILIFLNLDLILQK